MHSRGFSGDCLRHYHDGSEYNGRAIAEARVAVFQITKALAGKVAGCQILAVYLGDIGTTLRYGDNKIVTKPHDRFL